MKSIAITAAAALAATLAPAPCRAADDMRTIGNHGRQSAAFAGGTIRLPLGGTRGARPTARLQLGMISGLQGTRPVRTGGLEFGLTGQGKPEMFVGGQSAREMRERMQLNGSSGNTAAIVFGAVLVVVGLYVIINLDSLGDSGS
jgi:hypothetical protein